jgi:hypothetical protein
MIMVLLFLGVVFLLVGFQAIGSSSDNGSSSSSSSATATATPTATSASASATPEPVAARPPVRVYNLSDVTGLADQTASRLRDAQWDVTETGNLTLDGVTVTTVYFGDTPGEKEAADEVGSLLQATVEPRTPAVAEQPPGVIVAVTS